MGMLSIYGKVNSKHSFDRFCFVSNDFAFFILQIKQYANSWLYFTSFSFKTGYICILVQRTLQRHLLSSKFISWLNFNYSKDVLLNISRTQAAETFFVPGDLDLWPLTLTFKLARARDQTRLPCEFGTNTFSGSRDISYTNKNRHRQRQKQNLTQFTACGKYSFFKVSISFVINNHADVLRSKENREREIWMKWLIIAAQLASEKAWNRWTTKDYSWSSTNTLSLFVTPDITSY